MWSRSKKNERPISNSRGPAAAIGLLALLGAIPAYAADVVMEEPPAPAAPMEEPPLNTWAGPYAGVSLGYGFSGTTEARLQPASIDTDGFLLGGFAGYNYQDGNIVAGVEADIGYSWVEGDNAGAELGVGRRRLASRPSGLCRSPPTSCSMRRPVARPRTWKSRVGGVSDSNTMLGWTAGAGADVKVTEQVFGRVEYRYTDFGSDSFSTAPARDVSDKDNRVTFGLGMKF